MTGSPLIIVNRTDIEIECSRLRHMILINYCVSHERSSACLIPTGQAAFINHAEESQANVKIEWYDRNGYEALAERLLKNVTDLGKMISSSLDFTYRATRDIAAGEELVLFYGEHWSPAWNLYVKKKREAVLSRSRSIRRHGGGDGDGDGDGDYPQSPSDVDFDVDNDESITADVNFLPIFRQFIRAPNGLFPSHWLADPSS